MGFSGHGGVDNFSQNDYLLLCFEGKFEVLGLMEEIRIQNFLFIQDVSINIKPITVIIGPQASGKSTVAKVVFFVKKITDFILNAIHRNMSYSELETHIVSEFKKYFPMNVAGKYNSNFTILYTNDSFSIRIFNDGKSDGIKIELPDELHQLFEKLTSEYKNAQKIKTGDNILINNHSSIFDIWEAYYKNIGAIAPNYAYSQYYIPAGRSFFSQLQSNIFTTLLDTKNVIDPYILEFGSTYEIFKGIGEGVLNTTDAKKDGVKIKIKKIVSTILDGEYHYEKETVYLNNRIGKLNIANCSSGQQEILPLLLIIGSLPFVSFQGNGSTIYIEEPEAHLFPSCQKEIIDLLSLSFNASKQNCSYFITTHSPYIIQSINVALQLHEFSKKKSTKDADKALGIDYQKLGAYSIVNGNSSIITNDEYYLKETSLIDG